MITNLNKFMNQQVIVQFKQFSNFLVSVFKFANLSYQIGTKVCIPKIKIVHQFYMVAQISKQYTDYE